MQTANAKTLLVTKLDTKLGGSGAGGGGEGVGRAIGGVQKLQVPVLGSQRCLICAFNNHGTWSMSGARLRLLTQDFTRSFTGEEGGGRPRNWLSAKIASIDSIIANFKKDKRDHARTSVVGADSKRKGNARLIVAELDTKLGGSRGGGGGSAAQLAECKSCRCQHCHREVEAGKTISWAGEIARERAGERVSELLSSYKRGSGAMVRARSCMSLREEGGSSRRNSHFGLTSVSRIFHDARRSLCLYAES